MQFASQNLELEHLILLQELEDDSVDMSLVEAFHDREQDLCFCLTQAAFIHD